MVTDTDAIWYVVTSMKVQTTDIAHSMLLCVIYNLAKINAKKAKYPI